MPAFDPVRDAALHSPVPRSLSLPSTHVRDPEIDRRDGCSLDVPSPSSSRPSSRATASPSLTRRATDLAVLLNADLQEPRTPSSARSYNLSHILSDAPIRVTDVPVLAAEPDKLSGVLPLHRRSQQPSSASSRPFYGQHADTAPRSPSTPSPASRILPSSSPARSPVPSFPLLSSTSSSHPPPFTVAARKANSPFMPQPPPPVQKSVVPYNPHSRKTPANSVLVPMSSKEMEMYQNYRGIGTQMLLSKRRRSRSRSPDDSLQPPAKRRAGDVGRVIEHYNMRPDIGVVQRMKSPIIGLKSFNNWVKSVLITRFAHPVLSVSVLISSGRTSPARGKVLEVGCGKGGDLTKWQKANIRALVGVDIAEVSIAQARQRWETMRPPRFAASFAALDCYTQPLSNAFPPEELAQPFDVVSMQFCMHYAFETVEKARRMLQNVTEWLRKGGVFLGTIPNAEQLLERLDDLPESATDLSFGNSVYNIRFEDRNSRSVYGHRYHFWLKDAIDNVPEYIVHWDSFVSLAAEYSLYPIYKEEFHHIFTQHQDNEEFKSLLLRMKVVDANGESAMDEEQWEAANIYIGFVFEKR